jgi:hypothetical protein
MLPEIHMYRQFNAFDNLIMQSKVYKKYVWLLASVIDNQYICRDRANTFVHSL